MRDKLLRWIERVAPCTCNWGWCAGAWALRNATLDSLLSNGWDVSTELSAQQTTEDDDISDIRARNKQVAGVVADVDRLLAEIDRLRASPQKLEEIRARLDERNAHRKSCADTLVQSCLCRAPWLIIADMDLDTLLRASEREGGDAVIEIERLRRLLSQIACMSGVERHDHELCHDIAKAGAEDASPAPTSEQEKSK